MEVKTINPVLIDPRDTNVNGYLGTNVVNLDLKGQAQDVNVGDFVVKGTNPVFINDKEASQNEFLFAEPVEVGGETLTPMDEFLYSNAGGDERRARREARRANRKTATVEEVKANLQDIPGGPSKAEQEAKLNEGKFWNAVKGGWDTFSKSSSGTILIDSLTNYLSNKLGGNPYAPTGSEPLPPPKDDTPQPMSQTTKYVIIGGSVLVAGIIIYSLLKATK